MLAALSAAGAEYLVVGAHALAVDGVPRATGVEIEELDVPVLGLPELVRNKRAVGRTRDLADLEELGDDG